MRRPSKQRPEQPAALFVPAWLYPASCALLLLVLAVDSWLLPLAQPPAQAPNAAATRLFLPLVGQSQLEPEAPLAAAEPLAYSARLSRSILRLPLVAVAHLAPTAAPAPHFLSGQVPLAPAVSPTPAPTTAAPARSAANEAAASSCKVYPNVRITWYELGSCCGKAPGHPQYGVTRSGLQATWGMAAVQARWPLVPLGTQIIVKDLGSDYHFVVADTGSETAFGSSWVDIYAPTIAVGHWVERQVTDGRSDVLVCPP